MNFTPGDEAAALGELIDTILRDAGDTASSEASTWQALADAGVLGASLPYELDGAGLGAVETHVVLERLGTYATPLAFHESVVLGAHTIDRFGTDEQRTSWLPGVIKGQALLTAALHEPGPTDPSRPTTRATATASGWSVSGVKSQVSGAGRADRVLVPATTDTGDTIVLLIDPTTPGVTLSEQTTIAQRPSTLMTLAQVAVPAADRLGHHDDAGDILGDLIVRAEAGLASMQAGVLAGALRLAADHVSRREQFGRPIGTFQAVRQRLADAWIDAEAVRLTALHAAYLIDCAGADASLDRDVIQAVSIAKWWAAQGGHRVLHTAHHVHGGTGIDLTYPLHRFFRLAKHIEFSLGNASIHLGELGRLLTQEMP